MKHIQNPELRAELLAECNLRNIFSMVPEESFELTSLDKGDFLYKDDELSTILYIFVRGKVKVYTVSPQGKNVVFDYITTPRIFGEMDVLWNKPPQVNIQACEKSLCLGIKMVNHMEELQNNLNFMQYIARFLAFQSYGDNSRLAAAVASSTETRLAAYLLERETEDGILSFKLNETSEMILTSYRHLLRVLDEFTKQGIIKKENQKYHLLDREKLVEIANTSD